MTSDETRKHFLLVRDHVKQAQHIFTQPESYDGDILIKMQDIIAFLNERIGAVTFK